jgi:hypothetical protein
VVLVGLPGGVVLLADWPGGVVPLAGGLDP